MTHLHHSGVCGGGVALFLWLKQQALNVCTFLVTHSIHGVCMDSKLSRDLKKQQQHYCYLCYTNNADILQILKHVISPQVCVHPAAVVNHQIKASNILNSRSRFFCSLVCVEQKMQRFYNSRNTPN